MESFGLVAGFEVEVWAYKPDCIIKNKNKIKGKNPSRGSSNRKDRMITNRLTRIVHSRQIFSKIIRKIGKNTSGKVLKKR